MIVDQDNFTTSAMPIRFYVDNTFHQPPAISIVQPSNGDKVSGVISLRAIASDSDGTVKTVQFQINGGAAIPAAFVTDSWIAQWDSAAFNAPVAISATATDDKNAQTTTSIQVTLQVSVSFRKIISR